MDKPQNKPEEKQKIRDFLQTLKSEYGFLPKYAHSTIPKKDKVYYSGPVVDDDEMVAAIHTLLFGNWITSGGEVAKFEIQYSKAVNNKFSVMVNSGSSADLVMMAGLKKFLNWQDNDEIIISVVGFPTTLSSLTINNLKPIFIDIEMDTLNFDLDLVEKALQREGNKIKAIYISPVLGNPPDFDRLIELKEKYNIELILDGCDSLGSKWSGKELNEYVIASSASFYSAHHISVGEGGMISSNHEELIKLCRSIVHWGRACYCVGKANLLSCGTCNKRFSNWLPDHPDIILDHKYVFENIGYNLKPLDLQGAMGIEQLKKLDIIGEKRRTHKSIIEDSLIENINGLQRVVTYDKANPSWFGVPIICESNELKNKLVSYLEANGIQTRNYFAGNILLHPAYKHLDNWELYPNANEVLKRIFFVGCSPNYNNETLDYISNVINKFEK